MFATLGKMGATLEWAAAYAAGANPFAGAKNVTWMVVTPRRWQVTPLAEAVPTGADNYLQATLLRCIFGNPFRPPLPPAPSLLTWRSGLIPRLAQAAYDERAMPAGHLDPDRVAVLADALEEAGCTDAELLGHLRGLGPHVRGCWPVDLLTSRS